MKQHFLKLLAFKIRCQRSFLPPPFFFFSFPISQNAMVRNTLKEIVNSPPMAIDSHLTIITWKVILTLVFTLSVWFSSALLHLHTMRKQLPHRKYLATRWNLFVELDICTSELQWLNLIGYVYSTSVFLEY